MSTPRRAAFATLLAATLFAATATAQTQAPDEQLVARNVEALRQAMLSPDRAKLEALTADALSYGHSAGKLENKAQFVDSLVNRTSILNSIELSAQTVALSGDVAVVRHRFTGESEADGKRSPVRIGVLMVWQKQAGTWRLLARQAVPLPA